MTQNALLEILYNYPDLDGLLKLPVKKDNATLFTIGGQP